MAATVRRIKRHSPYFTVLAEQASFVIYRQAVGRFPKLQYINPAVEQLVGHTPEELYESPGTWASMTSEADRALIFPFLNDKSCHHAQVQTRWRHKRGHDVLVVEDLAFERSSTGRALAIEAIVRPVNLHPNEDRARNQALDSPIPELSTTTILSLNNALDMNDVMARILLEVNKIVPNDGASIMLVEDDYAQIVCQSGNYLRVNKHAEQPNQPISLSNPAISNDVIAMKRGVVIADVRTQSGWVTVAGTEWVRSRLAVPVIVDGHVIGLINLDSQSVGVFRHEDIRRLELFADYAAVAIRNVQRYDAEHFERLLAEGLQKSTEIMVQSASTDEVFSNILLCLNALIKCEWSAIMLIRSEQLVTAASEGIIPTAVGEGVSFDYFQIPLFLGSLNAAEPMTYGDIRREFDLKTLPALGFEPRSWVGVPVVVWDVIVGYLAAASTAADVLSIRDGRAMQAFAHQAALVIEHAEILSELEVSKLNLDLVRAQLLRTARLHMAGEIATGIAHKVNNPLTTVIAESYLLSASLADDSPQQVPIRAIRDAAFEAGTVVQRLMDTARLRPLVLRPIQVNDSVASAVSMIRGQIEPHIARLIVKLASNLPFINGSADHLRDLWLRLLLNARDAIENRPGGKIAVSTVYHSADYQVHVTISDNGKGIAPEHLDDVFKPLYTTKEHATGLGLAICNEIVLNHHGVIRVESEFRKGTSVHLSFPAAPRVPSGELTRHPK